MSGIEARFIGWLEKFQLDAEFKIPSTGVTGLFGQSGCGKTTVLRCLAGLERIEDGYLSIDGEIWQDARTFVPAHKRRIGYVFQEANLFDHLDVRANLNFGRKRSGVKEGPSFEEIVSLLGLEKLLSRHPVKLSGGERQRVAVGRALLSAPKLLLMDEPLSALDRFSKDEIIPYLEKLHEALSIPVVFISHDSDEVERLADHLLVMEAGRIRANGPLLDLLSDPKLFLAKSSKTASILEGRITGYDPEDELSEIDIAGKPLWISGNVGGVGQKKRLRIAATDVSLSTDKPSKTTILNVLKTRIQHIDEIGAGRVNVVLSLSEDDRNRLIARITTRSLRNFDFKVGQSVYAQIKGVSMIDRRREAS